MQCNYSIFQVTLFKQMHSTLYKNGCRIALTINTSCDVYGNSFKKQKHFNHVENIIANIQSLWFFNIHRHMFCHIDIYTYTGFTLDQKMAIEQWLSWVQSNGYNMSDFDGYLQFYTFYIAHAQWGQTDCVWHCWVICWMWWVTGSHWRGTPPTLYCSWSAIYTHTVSGT